MREILFRGKRIDNGEWITGHLLRYEDGRARINPSHTDIFCYEADRSTIQTVAYEVDPETVGQFTGRADDNNGKKIFEGDVIKEVDAEGIFCDCGVVCWNDLFSAWHLGKMTTLFGSPHVARYEVIGNIHDNPELLEAKNV